MRKWLRGWAGLLGLALLAGAPAVAEEAVVAAPVEAAAAECEAELGLAANADGDLVIEGTTLLRYDGDAAQVAVPAGVTAIGDGAFAGKAALRQVDLPGGLATVGAGAFRDCAALRALALPDSVTRLGEGAFEGCAALAQVRFPAGAVRLDTGAFMGCTALKAVDVALADAGSGVFRDCVALETATLRAAPMVQARMFENCKALRAVKLPPEVAHVGGGAFRGCGKLASIDLSATGATYVGENAFDGCTALKTALLPATLEAVRAYAFHNCAKLTKVNLEDTGVQAVYAHAFDGCAALKKVALPDILVKERQGYSPLPRIDGYAFANCKSLAAFTCGEYARVYEAEAGSVFWRHGPRLAVRGVEGSDMEAYCLDNGIPFKGSPSSTRISLSGATIALSSEEFTYDGEAQVPEVTVTLGGKRLRAGTDYSVACADNVDVGYATVTVRGVHAYAGTRTARFKILPMPTHITRLKLDGDRLTIAWRKRNKQVSGYQLQYSAKADFAHAQTVNVPGANRAKWTVYLSQPGREAWARVRVYTLVGSAKLYSEWSEAKSVRQ